MAKAGGKASLNIPGKTVLHSFCDGKVDDTPSIDAANYFLWSFAKLTALVVTGEKGELKVMALMDVIKDNKATSVFNHDKFKAWQPPATLTAKSSKAFVPKAQAAVMAAVITAVAKSPWVQLLWYEGRGPQSMAALGVPGVKKGDQGQRTAALSACAGQLPPYLHICVCV